MLLFDPFLHEYSDEYGNIYISVTQLLKKHHLSPDYSHVSDSVLSLSAEKGTKRHLAFQLAVESGGYDDGDDSCVSEFLQTYFPKYTNWQSEQMVYMDINAIAVPYAGTIDLICYDKDKDRYLIGDIKTTSSVHKESVAWQLSLYRMAWCYLHLIPKNKVDLFCLHAKDTLKWIDIDEIPQDDIEDLIACEAADLPYDRNTSLIIKPDTEALALEYESRMIELKKASDEIKNVYDKLKESLYEQMLEKNITTLETPRLKLSLTRPYSKSGFDSKSFQKDHPELFEAYKTETTVKGNVKISLKEKA